MKNKSFVSNSLLIPLFICQPMVWLILGIVEISNNKKIAYFMFAILIGMFGYVLFPWGDGFERYKVYSNISRMNQGEFKEFLFSQVDYFFYIISYLFNIFEINYQYIQFFFVFIGYYLQLNLFRKIAIEIDPQTRIIFFIAVIFLTNFLSLANGLRYELATIFLLYGIFQIHKFDKKITGFLFIFLSFTIHFYSIILFVLYLLSKKTLSFRSISSVKKLFILSLFLGMINAFVIQDVVKILIEGREGIFFRKIASYILGNDGTITNMISSLPQLIKHSINLSPMILIIYYLYKNNRKNELLIKIFFILLSFNNLWIFSFSLFLRIEHFLLLFGLYLTIDEYIHARKINNLFLSVLVIITLFYSIIQFTYFKLLISKDDIRYINKTSINLLYTSPLFLSYCTYDTKEIYDGNKNFMLLKQESLKRTIKTISNN